MNKQELKIARTIPVLYLIARLLKIHCVPHGHPIHPPTNLRTGGVRYKLDKKIKETLDYDGK